MVDTSFYQSDDPGRIVQSFSIIGLNENNLSLYDEEAKKPIFVEKIDIIKNMSEATFILTPYIYTNISYDLFILKFHIDIINIK
jgi:hypothetical protein